jgi:lon-related putative ATP-dependent protease
MNVPGPLEAGLLRWRCDPQQFDFETTEELSDLQGLLGQDRALEAVKFGISIRSDGYNLYALGPKGLGKRTVVEQFLQQQASTEETPSDWCYVNNFDEPHKPIALRLPAGRGTEFRTDMETIVDELQTVIPAALKIEEHRNQIQQVEQEAEERQEKAFRDLAEKAQAEGIKLVRTPGGFALAPLRDGEAIGPEDFEKLSPEEQDRIEKAVAKLQEGLMELIEKVPRWRKEARDKIKQLNREAARLAIGHLLSQLKAKYTDLENVATYLDAVEGHVIEHADRFHPDRERETPQVMFGIPGAEQPSFHEYKVNLLVDHSQTAGAPVVFEDHPNYPNLVGRVEHESRMGTLHTEFTLIKPGALHLANGGYLVIDARKTLLQPYAWEGFKRALLSQRLKIESLGEELGLISTISLQPEPIPLDVKVVLLGDRMLYYLLHAYDRDFSELFKVAADFDEDIDRSDDACELYARFLATQLRREKQRPLDCSAVAGVIEHAARLAGDAEKLSTHLRTVVDLLRESDYWASADSSDVIRSKHVEKAIEKQIYRSDRVRQHVQEQIQRETILIDTSGSHVGQVNGLSVIGLGDFSFGQPSRITATARLGGGKVVDIEREVELGGKIHSKGVLILSSFLSSRYVTDQPLSLSASLVFEQSYGMVDGDSASVGELTALLSILAQAPVKQSLAVTGSVNQHGQVQPIGGVNEKIEGFFDVCRGRGLSGDQGVVIPASNVKHLMLRQDVVDAAAEGKFHIYAVKTIDEAVTLLTGVEAGQRDDQDEYPEGTVNRRVEQRLRELSRLRKEFGAATEAEKSDE